VGVRPRNRPIGLQLSRTAKTVARAFETALAEAGGSPPTWLVLTSLRYGNWSSQHDLAREIGIEGPTLTRHLDGLESAGLVRRTAHPGDRRATRVELTEAGIELHGRLLEVVIAFDRRLTSGVAAPELEQLRDLLGRLERNVR
jgi:MarR family transcriptional regulator for hemolysin